MPSLISREPARGLGLERAPDHRRQQLLERQRAALSPEDNQPLTNAPRRGLDGIFESHSPLVIG